MEARLEGGSRGGVSGDLGKIMRSKQSIRGRSFPVCLSWEQRDFFFLYQRWNKSEEELCAHA